MLQTCDEAAATMSINRHRAPAVLNGTPLLTGALFGSGRRELAAEVSWDLPSLAPGATTLLDVTVNGARAGDLAQASLVAVWSSNTVRVMARNISAATFDLATATLSVGVTKRRLPWGRRRGDIVFRFLQAEGEPGRPVGNCGRHRRPATILASLHQDTQPPDELHF
ncbi:hypothetical protein [Roseococcus suduntuyensis]|uniref:Uncharacterized protein n=1 Tax=Roseococcus suduntuyensis TaxID=455361 RepID=A0A840ADM0_9PROT|nr:hypothetical protein [Roseococcus suduntuyensis]MBB3899231.1 hypothetical protein [Roseococcus suduntuyensis]